MFSASATSHRRNHRTKARDGISLLECLLSFAVLGIATGMLMQLATTRLRAQEIERNQLQAQLKLENFRERLFDVPYAEFEDRVNQLTVTAKTEGIRLELRFFDQSETPGWHLTLQEELSSTNSRPSIQRHLWRLKPAETNP